MSSPRDAQGKPDPLGLGPAWAALVEHTSDFVGLMTAEGCAIFMNRSVRGAARNDVEGKPLEEFLSPERAKQIRAMLEESKRTNQPSINDVLCITALDGSERWFIEKCVPLASEGGPYFMLLRTEVTHLRQTEEALLASEERYRILFDSSPDPVIVYDAATTQIVAVNAAASRMFGLSRDELLDRTWLDLFPESDQAGVVRRLEPLGPGATHERRGVVRHVRADRDAVLAEVVDNTIQFAGLSARVGVLRDVTQQERLESQLRHAQKMEAMGVFAGGVAHDFNNLLSIIAGFTASVRETVEPTSEAAGDLSHVLDATRRAADLTKKLMVFSKRQVLRAEQLDIAQIVDDFSSMLRRMVGNDVTLELVQPTERVPIRADRSQLEQIVMNLVMNARQAMPNGGTVTIATMRTVVDAAYVQKHPWARLGEFAELCVSDSGTGLDPQTAARAFEPFFTTKPEGTGLGLAVVHGIVQQHLGAIGIESQPGHGATFRVLLPLSTELRPGVVHRPLRASARGSERVLFAEDEPVLRSLTERSLRRLGYRVVAACDGEEAVEQFERAPNAFDLVVLDVVMPKLGGREALARMRASRPTLKALFVTGYAPETAGMGDLLEGTGLAVLRKPFTSLELAERLRHVLELA